MKTKPHGLKGRPSNAKKPANEKNDTCIHIRCRSEDKKMWELIAKSATRNSRKMNFSEWVIATLNDAIKRASSEKPLETLKTTRDLENLSRP